MSWYSYYDAREERDALRAKIKRAGKLKPLEVPQGSRKLASTFWGKAWCLNLENYRDYESRLPRGRSYLRQGQVYNLTIEPGTVTAQVAGSSLYDVRIPIQPLGADAWKRIKDDCAGQVGSLLDLLAGKLGDGVLRTITDPERGLFPKPKEIKLICSCPDYADMCKHIAAVLYGVGVLLDTSPDLFFILRSVDPSELLSGAAQQTLSGAESTDAALAGEDLSALFGIEMNVEPAPEPTLAKLAVKKPKGAGRTTKKSVVKKPADKKAPPKEAAAKKPGSKKISMRRYSAKKTRARAARG